MASSSYSPLTSSKIDVVKLADPIYLVQVLSSVNAMGLTELKNTARHISVHNPKSDRRSLLQQVRVRLRKHRTAAIRAGSMIGRRDNPKCCFDYLVCIDFECTCEDEVYDYPHEIIEFPAVLVDVKSLTKVSEFHTYVRPSLNPHLSDFCANLVGVTQEKVDAAPLFLDVLDDFQNWLDEHELGVTKSYAIVTDGPWDISKFLQLQCMASGLPAVPHPLRHYINLRRAFASFYPPDSAGVSVDEFRKKGKVSLWDTNPSRDWRNLEGMLKYLNLEFEGRPHCGLDDARNLANIAIQMLADGAEIRINERLARRDLAEKMVAESIKARKRRTCTPAESVRPLGNRNNRDEVNNPVIRKSDPHVARDTNLCKEESKPLGPMTREEQLDQDRKSWRSALPYKAITVNRFEFLNGMHMDCPSCDEDFDACGDSVDFDNDGSTFRGYGSSKMATAVGALKIE